MKPYSIILLCLLLTAGVVSAQSNAVLDFRNKYKDSGKYFSVKIEGGLLKTLSNVETNDPDSKELIRLINGIDAIDIHSISKSETHFGNDDYHDLMRRVKREKFEDLMVVNDSGGKINFMIKELKGKVSDLLLLVNNHDEFLVMNISGDIDLHAISKLSEKVNFKGSENLEKLKDE